MSGRVAGKVALITGAARGMGRAHATRLAAEGADVIAVDVCGPLPGVPYASADVAELEETGRQVEAVGRRVVTSVVDVRDLDGLRQVVDEAVDRWGRLDIVVANAAICIAAPWDEVTPEMFADTLAVNVTGVWNTVMAAAPHVVRSGGGSIVLISSVAGLKAQPFLLPYTTSKFAVRGMAKAFAAELGRHSVRVNSVHPTGVRTPMTAGTLHDVIEAGLQDDPAIGGMYNKLLPLDSLEPEDVADAVLWLASDEARYVTGHELPVDAGQVGY